MWFHAHPDDEATLTGGSMARAAAEGHRNVLVVATNGEHGEAPDDLRPGESLVERRQAELAAAAEHLGVHRIVWLGYRDSGMTGWPQNDQPGAFLRADLDEAGGRLAEIVREEAAAALVVYDWHGNYGHPDHIAVHRVGHRAAALLGETGSPRPRLFEATFNRDRLADFAAEAEAARRAAPDGGPAVPPDVVAERMDFESMDDGNPMGTPAAELTHQVDVGAYVANKRAALACHASQVTDVGFILAIPEDAFAASFGVEWFLEVGRAPGLSERWLLDED